MVEMKYDIRNVRLRRGTLERIKKEAEARFCSEASVMSKIMEDGVARLDGLSDSEKIDQILQKVSTL